MNKKVISFFGGAGLLLGSYLPILIGIDPTGLGGWSILGGFIGGILGVWLGTKIRT